MFRSRLCVVLATMLMLVGYGRAQGIGSCASNKTFATSAPITTSGTFQLVAAPNQVNAYGFPIAIRICAMTIQVVQGSPSTTWGLVSGTGLNCSVGEQMVTPQFMGTANSTQSLSHVYTTDSAVRLPTGAALCLKLSAPPTGAVVYLVYSIY